jgi:hypothetical protein
LNDFIEVTTDALTGPALDWAVARAAGISVELAAPQYGAPWRPFLPDTGARFAPSANWEQAGPLLEAHKIGSGAVGQGWVAYPRRNNAPTDWLHAPSALVAICRAVVADKLGLVVGIPAELAQ